MKKLLLVGFLVVSCCKGADLVITNTARVVGNGGVAGGCPGKYSGYMQFTKPSPTFGWAPTSGTNFHQVVDTTQTNTWVEALGKFGDSACNTNAVQLPATPTSPTYRFTVYFKRGQPVPPSPYTLTLYGFEP